MEIYSIRSIVMPVCRRCGVMHTKASDIYNVDGVDFCRHCVDELIFIYDDLCGLVILEQITSDESLG